jgi:phage terminase large subunit-like protein
VFGDCRSSGPDLQSDRYSAGYWDLTATEKTEFNDPDWTVGIKLGRDRSGGFWVLDMRQRANPCDVERLLLDTATRDGKRVRIGFGQDPGQAGKTKPFTSCARSAALP